MSEIFAGNNGFENYEIWDLKMPEISSRAAFYNLAPIGIGTAEVESLAGYISRLAQEHYLSPVVLLKNSVSDLSELPKSLLQNSISSVFAGSLNGFGSNTKSIVNILEKATFRDDIYQTSLLAFKDKLSNQKLLKKHLAWCPACYEEQKEQGKIVYDKLLWSIGKVKACHVHKIPLAESCPHCCKKLKVLSGKSRPGYCSKCLEWLGSNIISFDVPSGFQDEEDKKIEIWRTVQVGEFLTRNSSFFMQHRKSIFAENLNSLIQKFTYGNINDFAHQIQMWHISIRRLLKGEVLPTLEVLLNVCLPLKISLVELFEENNGFNTEKVISSGNIATDKVVTKSEMKTDLIIFLSEFPPPSANEVSRRTGWTTARLQRNFPDEYKLIVERYIKNIQRKLSQLTDEEIEQVLIKSARETPSPSLQSVFRKVGCRNTGYRYYRKFPELCGKITECYKKANRKKFDVKKAEKIMKAALEKIPAPSFSEVARKLKCTRGTLDKKLPQLSKSIHTKYENFIKTNRKSNHTELYNAVKDAVLKLQKNKAAISENQVKKNLPRKWNDEIFKKTYCYVLDELDLSTKK